MADAERRELKQSFPLIDTGGSEPFIKNYTSVGPREPVGFIMLLEERTCFARRCWTGSGAHAGADKRLDQSLGTASGWLIVAHRQRQQKPIEATDG